MRHQPVMYIVDKDSFLMQDEDSINLVKNLGKMLRVVDIEEEIENDKDFFYRVHK
jgi:hypothetical protein